MTSEDRDEGPDTPLFIRHPLPWSVVWDDETCIEDARGSHIKTLFSDDEFDLWPDTVDALNAGHAARQAGADVAKFIAQSQKRLAENIEMTASLNTQLDRLIDMVEGAVAPGGASS